MSNFEWQQEDGDWDEPKGELPPDSSRSKRTILIGIIIVLALSAAGLIVYWQVNEQLQQTETAVQTNILASHNIVQTAVSADDSELLLSVLSGRLPSWADAQQEILETNVMYDRAPWGLKLVADKSPELMIADLEDSASLTMSPDLLKAELRFLLDYEFLTASGVTETVVLSQTAVYRQGTRSWLLSPPDSEFWGNWQTNKGERLTLIYPARDSELASQLAADLEQILKQICVDPDLPDCAEDASYTIRLDTHPESLIKAADSRNLFGIEPYITLPAPTLFGLPGDDAAYDALLQAYGVPLATAVFADLFEWECCEQIQIFQALVVYQLSQMGLKAWPISPNDHIRALREGRTISRITDYWGAKQGDTQEESDWFLYTVFDFIFSQYPDLTAVQLLDNLQVQGWGGMIYWLGDGFSKTGYQLGGNPGFMKTLQTEWWQYAYTQTLLAQEAEALPIDLPVQDMALVCMSNTNFDLDTAMSLNRFDRDQESWQELMVFDGFVSFNPFLDDAGMVVQSLDFAETGRWQTEIWPFSGERTLLENDEEMFFTLGQFDPNGRFVVAFVGEDDSATPRPMLIDLSTCTDTDCDILPLSGVPYWSPSGQQTIVGDLNMFENGTAFYRNDSVMLLDASQPSQIVDFWLGDAFGHVPEDKTEASFVGKGYAPFWLDDNTFGFIQENPETGDTEVIFRSIDSDMWETAVTLADIDDYIPGDVHAPSSIRFVLTHPALPGKLFIDVLDALGREAYVFMVDTVSGELELLLQSQIRAIHSLGLSPNGRWLVLTGYQNNEIGESSTIIIHDIEANESETYTASMDNFMLARMYDWSADGNWILFLMNDRVLSMVAPEYNYQLVDVHEQGYCTSMAWINQ